MAPSPGWALASLASAFLIFFAEGWQLALPFLNGAGVDVGDLGAEFRRGPVPVLLGLAFAFGCTAMLVGLAHFALAQGQRALYGESGTKNRLPDAALAVANSLGAIGLAWLLAELRLRAMEAGQALASAAAGGSSSALPATVFVAVTAGLPFFSAFLLDYGRQTLARRAEVIAVTRTSDCALSAKEEERVRLELRVELAQATLCEIQAERSGSETDLQRLASLGDQASRIADEQVVLDLEALERAREELRAVLETDRFAYLKEAGRAGRREAAGQLTATVILAQEAPPKARCVAQEAA